MPHKRGFHNRFRVEYTPINLADLSARFPAGAVVDAEGLVRARLLKRTDEACKILGNGELAHPLTVRAPKVSAAARRKIEAAGGAVEELNAASADRSESN